uniref:Bcl-2 Bcl-2 homology region 1-3 domain-containing protein n=1 Tax=Maylandia zebra TaxID=106582 RepID=A0A3P9D9X2_9CICH
MLSLQTTAAEVPMVTRVARTLFSDGIINWGRIVSLVAYGTVLLQASKSTLGPECAYAIGVSIAAYITDNHMDWLAGTDGWVGWLRSIRLVLGLWMLWKNKQTPPTQSILSADSEHFVSRGVVGKPCQPSAKSSPTGNPYRMRAQNLPDLEHSPTQRTVAECS